MPNAGDTPGIGVRVNGVVPTMTNAGGTSLTTTARSNTQWYLGARASAALFNNIRFYHFLVINRAVTAAEQAYLEAL